MVPPTKRLPPRRAAWVIGGVSELRQADGHDVQLSGKPLKDRRVRLPLCRVHLGIPIAQEVDYLVLIGIEDVVAHHSVLAGRQTGAEAREGCRSGAGGEGGVYPRGNVALSPGHDCPEERRVGGFLLQEGTAEAVGKDHANTLRWRQLQVVGEARHAQGCGSAGQDFRYGLASEKRGRWEVSGRVGPPRRRTHRVLCGFPQRWCPRLRRLLKTPERGLGAGMLACWAGGRIARVDRTQRTGKNLGVLDRLESVRLSADPQDDIFLGDGSAVA